MHRANCRGQTPRRRTWKERGEGGEGERRKSEKRETKRTMRTARNQENNENSENSENSHRASLTSCQRCTVGTREETPSSYWKRPSHCLATFPSPHPPPLSHRRLQTECQSKYPASRSRADAVATGCFLLLQWCLLLLQWCLRFVLWVVLLCSLGMHWKTPIAVAAVAAVPLPPPPPPRSHSGTVGRPGTNRRR
jgi:hypothetical protein